MIKFLSLISICFLWSSLGFSETFDALHDHSLGYDSVTPKSRGGVYIQSDAYLVDGKITTLPVNTVTYDRTAVNETRLSTNVPFSNRLSSNFSLFSKVNYQKIEGAVEPRKIDERKWIEAKGTLEFTVVTASRLELFVGATYLYIPAYETTSASLSVSTKTSVGKVGFPIPHFGVMKHSNSLEGGLFYIQGGQRDRTLRKTVSESDDILIFSETVYEPTVVAAFAKLKAGSGSFFSEFAAVQASEGGPKTDNGDTELEDYQRLRLIYYAPLGWLGLKAGLTHRTLSYADNRNVGIETMPMSALTLKLLGGGEFSNGFIGIIGAYGRDGQSLREFNAKYQVFAFGGSVGLNLTF